MAGSLESVLARIPGIGGYLAKRQFNDQEDAQAQASQMGQLQQMGALQGILAKVQAAKQAEAYRSGLRPDMTPEEQVAHAAQFSGPEAVMRTGTSHLDRQATLEAAKVNQQAQREQRLTELTQRGEQEIARVREAEAQRRITKEEADGRERSMREGMARLAASLRPSPQPRALQLTTDAAGNQLIVNPDGTTRPLTTEGGDGVKKAVGADKPMTEFQGKAALYGTRSAQSDKVLRALEDKISVAGLRAGQAAGVVGNAFLSSEQRRVDQAQRDFVNAVLRQESGAVISDAEFANAKKQYFPEVNDDAKTISQKRANRQLAIQGFSRMSGPKGAADIKAIIDEPLLPGAPATAQTPQQAGGRIGAPASGWKVTPVP